MKRHAYLIMAHNEFHMLKKLLTELDDERNDIYLHIDKKTRYVDEDEISSWIHHAGVFFVPRIKVSWGTLSLIKCEMSMLEEATKKEHAYYHLISGTDFPLKSQDYIYEQLAGKNNEFLECHKNGVFDDYFMDKIRYYYPLLKIVGKDHFEGPGKKNSFMRQIVKLQYGVLRLQKKLHIDRAKKYKDIEFFKGNQWFTITHEFALHILKNKEKLFRMYRLTNASDEIAINTLAMNSAFSKLVNGISLRKIDWFRGEPYEFKLTDLEELKSSEEYYARKISFNNEPLLVNRLIENIHGQAPEEALPLISIIVPCYNVADYLEECVLSLVKQSYKNLEILLIDDGSTDSTADIAKSLADKYENVFYHYKTNGGLSSARNRGIDLSKGEYIAFIDSDDWIDPEFVDTLYKAAKDGRADISVCGYRKEENDEGVVTFDEDKVISSHAAMRILGDIYPKENVLLVIACNKLFKRSIFDDVRFCEGRIHEDECAAHRILGASEAIALITQPFYHYRIREGSITSSDKQQSLKRLDYLYAMKDRLEYTHTMMYGDLVIYMLYTYFEGMKQLMATYTDETMKKHKLYSYFRSQAFKMYCRYYDELDGFQKKDYLKLILAPGKYRDNVIRLRNLNK